MQVGQSIQVFMTGTMLSADVSVTYINEASVLHAPPSSIALSGQDSVAQLPEIPLTSSELYVSKSQRAFASLGSSCRPFDCVSFTSQTLALDVQDTIVYHIHVVNSGSSAASGFRLEDSLPAGFVPLSGTAASLPSGCILSGGVLSCMSATLAANAQIDIVLTGTIPSATTTSASYPNNVSVRSDNDDVCTSSTSSHSRCSSHVLANTLSLPSLQLNKTVSPQTVGPGETVVYTLSYSNIGQQTGSQIVLQDIMPAGIQLVSATGDYTSSTASGRVIDDL